MPRVNHVKKALKDNRVVKKGEPYYWWKIKTGPASGIRMLSATYPRQSQLTRSDYLSAIYSVQENFEDRVIDADDDFQAVIDEIRDEVQEILDETQGKFDNMPEGLQQGDTGQLLEERIGTLENVVSELEGIDVPDFNEIDEDDDVGDKEGEKDSRLQQLRDDIDNALSQLE